MEVQMLKNCMPLWRNAHLKVKMYKTPHVWTTFRCFDIRHSQQSISPIRFLFLKLPPPPCAVLLVITNSNTSNTTLQTLRTLQELIASLIQEHMDGGVKEPTGWMLRGFLTYFGVKKNSYPGIRPFIGTVASFLTSRGAPCSLGYFKVKILMARMPKGTFVKGINQYVGTVPSTFQ